MKHIPMIGKVLVVLMAFGTFVLLSVVFTTAKMRHIDDAYSAVIDGEGKAAVYLSRANRAISEAKGAIADLTISTSDADDAAKVDVLRRARQLFLESMDKAQAVTPATSFSDLKRRGLAIIDDSCQKTVKLGVDPAVNPSVSQAEYMTACDPVFDAFVNVLNEAVDKTIATEDKVSADLTDTTNATILITYLSVLGGMAIVLVGAYFAITAWISRPLKTLAAQMAALAAGDLSVAVGGAERRDEIGPMAQAVQVFKDSGIKLKHTEADATRHRQTAEQERGANEATRAEIQRQQEAVVASIANGLDRLSKGDLTGRLSQVFAVEYEKLRADFNATAESLQDALGTISVATNGISTGSDQIAQASDDLSRRTEQQAANLEETSAALNVITDTVKTMAANAGQAAKVVVTTRTAAESSGAIVAQAVEAMGKIKESSNQISNIIGVIDEIAFQTNLLALNAGVEAARAGDAGRGFAVVASEVRGLAQRSAEAAKEIKALISASTVQVESGVVLVDKTGVALKDIIVKVAEMDGLVSQISAASQEQATGLAEINTAVRQMDQVVQQNAAMVEESTAAAHALKSETQDLTTMVGRFQIGDKRTAQEIARPAQGARVVATKTVKNNPRPSAPRPMLKTTSSAAPRAAQADQDWEEF